MNNKKIWRYFFLIPVIIYVALLIALPLLYILLISFFKSDSYGGMITTFTIQNYIEVFDQVYINVFLKSILIAGLTTFICILISYPFVFNYSLDLKNFVCLFHKNKYHSRIIICFYSSINRRI